MKRRREIIPVGDFTADEIMVAETMLLLHLPRVNLKVESGGGLPTWAVKRSRSFPGRAMRSFRLVCPGSGIKCEAAAVGKAEALSPATPHSFPPSSESDEKPKQDMKKKISPKRKREEWMVIIDGLTQDRISLKREIENMRRNCDNLRAFNLELKTKLRGGPCLESGKIGSENQMGQLHALLPSSCGFGVAHSNVGPSGLPDLNVSAEEAVEIDSSALDPIDLAKYLARTMAAQARHKRTQIRRLQRLKCR